ncbi:hypothetical protein KY290_001432 [Solanum tuberosum]|uniref:Uncharacterized protein n=1 Tax=Solanum tuberosum TaxID=4113 RepID=A0ABQ7WMA9_SOLTU|nr:hypothetical protein KY285_001342 [Solanum tuberosum]KAH0781834.1 hypothetical protein KY290_001432 [Solanum tuberosum]
MAVLLSKTGPQGWSALFLQGDIQRKMAKREVTEFYINRKSDGLSFTSTVRSTLIQLVPADVARILEIPFAGVLNQDKNGHAFPYGFWMASIFESFDVPVQVWVSQTVKDVVGRVNHMTLPISMRRLNSPLQRLKYQPAEKEDELAAMTTAHQLERESWEAQVVVLQNELDQERNANIATVRHLTNLLSTQNPSLVP